MPKDLTVSLNKFVNKFLNKFDIYTYLFFAKSSCIALPVREKSYYLSFLSMVSRLKMIWPVLLFLKITCVKSYLSSMVQFYAQRIPILLLLWVCFTATIFGRKNLNLAKWFGKNLSETNQSNITLKRPLQEKLLFCSNNLKIVTIL